MRVGTESVAVLGAGSWGTALSCVAAWRGCDVRLWGRRDKQVEYIQRNQHNPDYLAKYELPPDIRATSDMAKAVDGARVIIAAVASSAVRSVAQKLAGEYKSHIVVSAAKGLEPKTRLRMSQVLLEELPSDASEKVCSLSGPNFAAEVIEKLPAGTVVACPAEENAAAVQKLLSGPELRVYTSDDLLGVELGGALKNVYAMGVGMVDSLGLGYNAQSTLITRGLAEMVRLGVALGAHPLTFAGLSGLGDMVLTCTTDLSRNRRTGLALGRGETLQEIQEKGETVEGIRTARVAAELADAHHVEMPIVKQVCSILFDEKDPLEAVDELMTRSAKTEREVDFVTRSAQDWLKNS